MSRWYAAILLGFAAYWLAIGVGIPSWRQWQPGDAVDIGLCVAAGVLVLTSRQSPHRSKGE